MRFTVTTERRTELRDVTDIVVEAVERRSGALAVIFVPHTTAGVLLQASGVGAREVVADVEAALERLVDESWSWRHTAEGDRNPWAHVRSVIAGSSVSIPMVDGVLMLGHNQRIFLAEFDGPRERTVYVSVAR